MAAAAAAALHRLTYLIPPLQLPAMLAEVSLAVSSVSRVTKRQGCSGLKDLASTLGTGLGEASSGRRLIRRVLSQIPGRTWDGKEELLEAVVALCASSKGSAVTMAPFVWGESGAVVGFCARGVKRNRSSEPLMEEVAAAEIAAAAEEDDEQENENAVTGPDHGTVVSASVGISGDRGKVDTESKKKQKAGPTGTEEGEADDDDADNADGAESPCHYEDKVGDLKDADPAMSGAAENDASSTAPMSAQHHQQQRALGGMASGEPRNEPVLETGMASLDMEDDSPVPFGEVVAVMLAALRR